MRFDGAKICQVLVPTVPKAGKKCNRKSALRSVNCLAHSLSELLNPEHPLYVLAERIDWSQFDAAIDACYAEELGRPGVNTRLMVGLVVFEARF